MNCLRGKDPLVLHDIDAPNSEAIKKAIAQVDGHIFRPSLLSLPSWFGGNS